MRRWPNREVCPKTRHNHAPVRIPQDFCKKVTVGHADAGPLVGTLTICVTRHALFLVNPHNSAFMNSPPASHIDLTHCETEPICYPGAIQPHGVLLGLSVTQRVILAASQSCQAWLGLSAQTLLGQALGQVFGSGFEASLQAHAPDGRASLVPLSFNGRSFVARCCTSSTGQIVLDIESDVSHLALSSLDMSYLHRGALADWRELDTVAQVTQAAAHWLRGITGFDQVMIYRFDADWNGEVIAESVASHVQPYLGLNFPAGDIPAQARELFRLCRIRLIPDVSYAPSPLLAVSDPHAIDIGRSSLRSVSPIHLEYLRYMGARATMVGALVVEGRLWGLVSCQQKNAPKFLSPAERDVLAWVCDDLSALIQAKWTRERRSRERSLTARRRTLVAEIRRMDFRQLMQAQNNADLLGVVGADGFALVKGDSILTTGHTPELARIRDLDRCFLARGSTVPLLASHALCRDFGLADTGDGVAGVLFVSVLRKPVVTMIWFRRERQALVSWGGDPRHPHLCDETGRMSPRKSFDQFMQKIRGQALAWSSEEVDSAHDLSTLIEINALRESESHLREAQQIASLGSWEWEMATGLHLWSDQQYRIFGLDPQTTSPSADLFFQVVHPDDHERVKAAVTATVDRHVPYNLECRIVRPEGETRHVHISGHLEHDPAGHPQRMVGTLQDITERIQTRTRLENLLAEQKALLDNSLIGIAQVCRRQIVWANPAFESMLGYATGELTGQSTFSVYNSEDTWLALGAAAHPVLFAGKVYRTEIEFMRKDRKTIWVDLSGVMIDMASKRSLWCYVEITEQKRAFDLLRESESRFRALADSAPVMIWMAGTDKLCHWFNQGWLSFTGRSIAQESGNGWAEGIHASDSQLCLDTYTSAFDARQDFVVEYRLRRFDGQYRWLLDHGVPRFDANGQFSGYIGSCLDITDTKQIAVDLQASQHRLLLAQEGAHVGIWEWNLSTGEPYWSPECERLYGLSPGTLKSINDWQSRVHPDDLALIDAQWDGNINLGNPFEVEYRVLLDSGETRWILSQGRAQYDASGHPIQLSGINLDVTARRNAEAELIRAKDDALAANVAKSRFLATMSHEIRTPMNGILGMTQLLLMPDLTDSERREYARTILSSGQTLLTLLNDILDLSKIEAGKMQLERIVFDADALLRETRALFSGAAHTKSLQLLHRWRGTTGSRYLADAHRLRQMLSNLVGNAIKFTQQGSIRIEGVELLRDSQSVMLEFSVTDTGIGVPSDKLALLFKPFSQTDSSTTREFGGTGLGLSIVSQLAKMMGGEVGIDSTPGQGSRFWFRMRAECQAPEEDSRSHERPDRGHAVAADTPPTGRVLVVEDNVVNCMVIESLLNKIGVTLTLAYDGQQALDAITQGDQPDLILMDLHMPVMDGYTATERIRQWEFTQNRPHLPIVALTADAFLEDRQRCKAAGMDDFLTKPIGFSDLKLTLSKWLPVMRESAVSALPSDAAIRPLDHVLFGTMVDEIKPLLAQNMFDAIARFKELQALTAGTEVATEMNEIDLILSGFRFDVALQRLNHLAELCRP